MKDFEIQLLYSGAMALILPQLKYVTNFVLKLIQMFYLHFIYNLCLCLVLFWPHIQIGLRNLFLVPRDIIEVKTSW